MSGKKKIVGGVARLVQLAKAAIVVRYLALLQLSTAGDLGEQVQRLQGWLEARTLKAEPELDPYVQICTCEGIGHAAFKTCPFCGDEAESEDSAAQRKRGTEEQAIAQLLSRWPPGFERVVPAPPAAIVKTSPKEVAVKKRSRSEAAAAKVVEPEVQPDNAKPVVDVDRVAKVFAAVLDAHLGEALSKAALLDAAEQADDGLVGLDLATAVFALGKLVDDGRATHVGPMYTSGKAEPEGMGVEDDEEDAEAADLDPEDAGEAEDLGATEGTEGPASVRGSMLAGGTHVHVEETPTSGTVEELDHVITEIHRLHGAVAVSLYEQGLHCANLIDRRLYLQRRDAAGQPKYKTFAQFAKAELGIEARHAYQLAEVSKKYTRVQIEDPKLGIRKLTVLLAVKDNAIRHELTEQTRQAPVTAAALQHKVEALKAQQEPEDAAGGEEEDDTPPRSRKLQAPAAKKTATPTKGPAAKATPVQQRITVALVPGQVIIPLMQRVKGKGAPKPARKLEQDPWAQQELGNGVTIAYRIFAGPGGILQLAIDTTRVS